MPPGPATRHGGPAAAGFSSAWAPESYGAPLSREGSFVARPASEAGSYAVVGVNDGGWLSGLGDLACCAGPVGYGPGMAGGYQQLPHASYAYVGYGDPAAQHFERQAMGKDIAYTRPQKALCAAVLAVLVLAATYGVTALGWHYQSQHVQRQEAAAALGQGGAAAHSLTLAPGGAVASGPVQQARAPAPGAAAALAPAAAPPPEEAASEGSLAEPQEPAGATEAVLVAPMSADASVSTNTTLRMYDCPEQSADRSTWSALRIVWCCQHEEVACDLADKAPGAAGPVDQGSCAQYGCVEYDPEHDCQCNTGCLEHSNCCEDFAQSCASLQSWPEAPGADAAQSLPVPLVDASAAAPSQDATTSATAPRSAGPTTLPPSTASVTSPAPSTTAVEPQKTARGGSTTSAPEAGAAPAPATSSSAAAADASSAGEAAALTKAAADATKAAADATKAAADATKAEEAEADATKVASTGAGSPTSPPSAGGGAPDAAALPAILGLAPGKGPAGVEAPGSDEAQASGCGAQCAYRGQNSTCGSRLQFAAIYEFDGSTDACSSAYDMLVHDCPVCSSCVPKAAGCESALNNTT